LWWGADAANATPAYTSNATTIATTNPTTFATTTALQRYKRGLCLLGQPGRVRGQPWIYARQLSGSMRCLSNTNTSANDTIAANATNANTHRHGG